jgi:hypothetical protein
MSKTPAFVAPAFTYISGLRMKLIQHVALQGLSALGWSCLFIAMAILANLAVVREARATFGGANGQIVYLGVDTDPGAAGQYAIFTTDGGQISHPVPAFGSGFGELHQSPAYSPDGKSIAFIERGGQYGFDYSIELMDADGSNRRTLLPATAIGPGAQFTSLTWLVDGAHIAVTVLNTVGGDFSYGGIWSVAVDGSGFSELLGNFRSDEQTIFELDGSPIDNGIVFRCRFRVNGSFQLHDDLCILDADGGLERLPVDWPVTNSSSNFLLYHPHWTPDGQSIVFVNRFNQPPDFDYAVSEIFTIHRDGTGLTELTLSPKVNACGITPTGDPFGCFVVTELEFLEAMMSPDGKSIIALGVKAHSDQTYIVGFWDVSVPDWNDDGPTSQVSLQTAIPPTLWAPYGLNWQPKPGALEVSIEDGHSNPLRGLKVELFTTADDTRIGGVPINTDGGRYVFDDPIPPGDYHLVATLIDNCQPVGCVPAFDIRYAPTPADPVNMTFLITVAPASQFVSLNFDDNDTARVAISIPDENSDRLDDMANIYFRMRQYLTWVKANLIPDTGPTVQFHAFAINDPVTQQPLAKDDRAYYLPGSDKIVLSTEESEFENRDGILDSGHGNDAPTNGEWHEFTHHLWYHFVSTADCGDEVNHAGYTNKTTCDSTKEGFAEFLPMLAAQDIGGVYQYDLNSSLKPWFKSSKGTFEDFSVASIFWDLVDSDINVDPAMIFGADGEFHAVIYKDQVSIPLSALWAQLTMAKPSTVQDLYASFGPQTPAIDLDGDGVNDVSLIDEVFLMHGFYPVDVHKNILGQDTYNFDVNYQRTLADGTADSLRGAVGWSDHHVFNSSGELVADYHPRRSAPVEPHSKIQITVLDASGTALAGSTLNMVFNYPGGQQDTIKMPLPTSDNFVYLQLPPYFNYLLPQDAPLPACDPANDLHANVTLSVEKAGVVSNESPTIDNCSFWQAVDVATGPAALAYTLTVPIGPSKFTLTLGSAGNGSGTLVGAGSYTPGQAVTVSATPDTGSSFNGWSGPDAAECTTGSVVMSASKSCVATFSLNTYVLTLNTAGTGNGIVVGGGAYNSGQTVTVSATASSGSTFNGWSGANAAECTTGSVAMTSNKSCTATFAVSTYALTLSTAGNGGGAVAGGGTYAAGQTAAVSATANSGSTFSGWSGPNAAECTTGSVLMTAYKSCTATFTLVTYTLSLNVTGTGSGTVSGAGTYNSGQTVAVAAAANSGSTFSGWSGPNAAECTTGSVLMTAYKSCTATMTAVVSSLVVPNVVGLTQAAAAAAIHGAGLVVGTLTTQPSAKVLAGDVLSETPKAGSKVSSGSSVNLVLATNYAMCDVNGDKEIDWRDVALVAAGLGGPAAGPYDPRDPDRNGVINARDVLKCASVCTHNTCAIK